MDGLWAVFTFSAPHDVSHVCVRTLVRMYLWGESRSRTCVEGLDRGGRVWLWLVWQPSWVLSAARLASCGLATLLSLTCRSRAS